MWKGDRLLCHPCCTFIHFAINFQMVIPFFSQWILTHYSWTQPINSHRSNLFDIYCICLVQFLDLFLSNALNDIFAVMSCFSVEFFLVIGWGAQLCYKIFWTLQQLCSPFLFAIVCVGRYPEIDGILPSFFGRTSNFHFLYTHTLTPAHPHSHEKRTQQFYFRTFERATNCINAKECLESNKFHIELERRNHSRKINTRNESPSHWHIAHLTVHKSRIFHWIETEIISLFSPDDIYLSLNFMDDGWLPLACQKNSNMKWESKFITELQKKIGRMDWANAWLSSHTLEKYTESQR